MWNVAQLARCRLAEGDSEARLLPPSRLRKHISPRIYPALARLKPLNNVREAEGTFCRAAATHINAQIL